jgi:hypothetical protein
VFACLHAVVAFGQTTTYAATQGYCQLGATKVVTQGMNSTTMVQASYPKCQVKVYLTGTTNLQTIYADKGHTTQLANPFTATTQASWLFYSATGANVDIVLSGGTPVPLPQTVTLADVSVGGGGGGGGSGPANNLQEIQANLNGTLFQGTGSYTDVARTVFYQPAINSPNRNICGLRGCGMVNQLGYNIPVKNNVDVSSGWGQAFYNYRTGLWTGLSYFNGYNSTVSQGTEPPGGSSLAMQSDSQSFHMMSIMQDISINTHAGKPYDTANIYTYLACHGGYWGGGDEGCTNIRANGGNDSNRQGAIIVSGTPTPGATVVNYSNAFNPDDIMVGGFLIDIASPSLFTGNITGYDTANHLLTISQPAAPLGTGSIVVPTSAGTTTTAITITQPQIESSNGVGVSKTVSVSLDSGTAFSPTAVTLLVCVNPTWEFVIPTSFVFDSVNNVYNLTATFQHGHPAGCYVQQGGTWGIADLNADRINNAILNAWRTDYFVYGATDANHIHEATWLTGARGFINPWRHNFGGGQNHVTNAQISGNGSVITLCGLGQSSLNFASSYIQISNANPAAYNGLYTTGPMDNNFCTEAAGTATGAVIAATVDVGGAVNNQAGTAFGPGGFTIWPTARIKQLGTQINTAVNGAQTIVPNNSLILYPNTMTNVASHIAVILDDMQSKVEPLSVLGTIDTSPTQNLNHWFQSVSAGYGVTTTSYFGADVTNANPYSWYKGGGTCTINGGFCLDGAIGMNIGGPWVFTMRLQQPLAGGTLIEGYPSPMAAANQGNNTHFFVRDDGPGGNPGFYVNFNPNTGVSNIGSGTGNGVQSVISMTPKTMTIAATDSITIQTAALTLNALQGAGTRCVTASSVGLFGTQTCGTVSSVGVSVPGWASSSGGPVTGSGTISLNFPAFVGAGASHAPGIVPDPGATPGLGKFLRDDGSWSTTTGFSGSCAPTTTATVLNGLITGCT